MEEEIWRPIDGHDGYAVSNLGRVRSVDRTIQRYYRGKEYDYKLKGKILSLSLSKLGYLRVKLGKNGKIYFVHRLVAEAFIPKIKGCNYINHKDEDKRNNVPGNLEWCTTAYNNNYNNRQARCRATRIKNDPNNTWVKKAVDTKRRTGVYHRVWINNLSNKIRKVRQLDMSGNFIKEWESVTAAANSVNTSTTKISGVCNGKRLSAKGYKWEYVTSI